MSNGNDKGIGYTGKKQEPTFEQKYLEKKWIVIPMEKNTIAGYVSKIEHNYAILNPHKVGTWNERKGYFVQGLIDKDEPIHLPIPHFKCTSRRGIEKFCELENEQVEKNLEKIRRDMFDPSKKSTN